MANNQIIIGLDLALTKTGVAIVDESGKFKDSENIATPKNLTDIEKISYIISILGKYMNKTSIKNIIIEDTYFGVNFRGFKQLSKLVGAVEYWAYKKYKKQAIEMMACRARKLMGLNGRCHKVEVQLFILKYLKSISKKNIKQIEDIINELRGAHEDRKNLINTRPKKQSLTLEQFKKETKKLLKKSNNEMKNALLKLSRLVNKNFTLSEHEADAILLALAGRRI